MMSFLSGNIFNFINESKLVSRFKNLKRFTQEFDLEFDEDAIGEIDANKIFIQLMKEPIEINVIQTFALMGWHNTHWKTPYGQQAMLNWWLSVIREDQKGHSLPRLIMVLRSILADTERYPAPKDVVQVMGQVLQDLLKTDQWGHDHHIDLVQSLIQHHPKQLAYIALDYQCSVAECLRKAKFPSKLPIVQEANLEWLNLWIKESPIQRKILRQTLSQVLNNHLDSQAKYKLAIGILMHPHFNIDKIALEKAVKDYPELVAWLSYCSRDSEFKKELSNAQRQLLGIWIGTGNYESLRKTLMDLAKTTDDPQDEKRTDSRYIFWHSYQSLFQEAWLLLPSQYFKKNTDNLINIKEIQGTPHAVIILRLNDYFIFQYFLGTASQINLLVTKDIEHVEALLNQSLILNWEILQLNLLLIHDHEYKWQSDLAFTLEKNFNIESEHQRIRYPIEHGDYRFSYYHKDIKNPKTQEARKEVLSRWLQKNLKKQFNPNIYNKAALTAKRYGLLGE